MLSITITKTAIYFNDLNDEIFASIKKHYPDLEFTPKGKYAIFEKPDKLYKILLDLSYTYDIEIS